MDSTSVSDDPASLFTVNRRRALQGLGGGLAATMLVSAASRSQSSPPVAPAPTREIVLEASEFDWELAPGMPVKVWGYNGQMPGPEIRVTEGETVRVVLRNKLSVPTTVHWHGVHLHPAMDGPAGLNQAAVEPGQDFTYEFTATPAGTRWYHSHADPQLQVPMGLYGSLIIEPREPITTYDREYTLLLGEWDTELTPQVAAGLAPRGPRDQQLRGGELGADLYLLNGKIHGGTSPIVIAEGERILLRVINAGHMAHPIHIHGHTFAIVATDGNDVPAGFQWKKDTVFVAPGERYDLALEGNNPGVWMVHCHIEHHMANGMMTLLQYEGSTPTGPAAEAFLATSHSHQDAPPATPVVSPTKSAASNSPADAIEVVLRDNRIDPASLTVQLGCTVTWTNIGSNWHSVAAYDESFSSGRIAPGESFSHRFDVAGTVKYLCQQHAMQGMLGTISVSPA